MNESVSSKVDQFIQDTNIVNALVHGPKGTHVPTDGGDLPTFATVLGDATDILDRVSALEDGQSAVAIVESTWARLISTEPGLSAPVGTGADIPEQSDAGSHVDPIKAGGQVVPNAGRYVRRNSQPSGWEWLAANTLSSKANKVDVDNILATGVLTAISATGDDALMSFCASSEEREGDKVVLGRFRAPDGAFDAPIATLIDGVLPLKDGLILTTDKYGDDLMIIAAKDADSPYYRVCERVAADGQRFNYAAPDAAINREVVDARGTTASLSERLRYAIRPDGYSPAPGINRSRLRNFNRKVQDLATGAAGTKLHVAVIGDSWNDQPNYYLRRYAERIKRALGNGGSGFMPVERWGPDTLSGTPGRSGSGWTVNNFLLNALPRPAAPAIVEITASAPGNTVYVNSGKGSAVRLYYKGSAGSVMRYRFNGGAWTSFELVGANNQYAEFPSPGEAAEWSFVAEVVSGSCTVRGLEVINTSNGIVIHKLGAGSSRASHWPSQWEEAARTEWKQGLSLLPIDCFEFALGVNDAFAYGADQYLAYMETLIADVRSVHPLADISVVSNPQTLGGASYSQFDQAYAMRRMCSQKGFAHLNMQPFFGETTAEYDGKALDLINSLDANHPTQRGGSVYAAAKYNFYMGN